MKWFTVEEKRPKSYKDYLILKENGSMQVCFGYELEDGSFQWDTRAKVLYYGKLPNSPRGTNIVNLKKEFDIKMEEVKKWWNQ